MRKISLLLTVLALCVALVSCGLTDEEKRKIELYDKYEDLILSWESKDSSASPETDPVDETIVAEKWMKEIVGTWYHTYNGSDITFCEDATCVYDGKTYSVEFDYERGNDVQFLLKDGEATAYEALLYKDYADNGTSTDLILLERVNEYRATGVGSYLCAADYNAQSAEWTDDIIGTWYAIYNGSDITFCEDATCVYDGKTYNYSFKLNNSSNTVTFVLKDGEATAYEAQLYTDYADNGTSSDLWLYEIVNENKRTSIGDYMCAADHEAAEAEAKATAEKCLKEVVGTWYNMEGILDITFCEDGTCTYNGKTYSVEYNSDRSNSTDIYFNLMDGETAAYLVELERNYADNGTSRDIVLWAKVDNGYSGVGGYLCAADYNVQSAEWMGKLVGDWISAKNSITFNNEGTCLIGETTYTVRPRLDYSSDSAVYFYLYNGNIQEYQLGLAKDFESNGVYADMTLWPTSGSYSNFVRASDYEAIELTVDNWRDYFEIVEVLDFNENAFGEVDSLEYYRYYCLKDEYVNVTAQYLSTNIAIEYTPVNRGDISCVVDPINRTFTKGEIPSGSSATTKTETMSYSYSSYSEIDYRLGFRLCNYYISKDMFENGKMYYTDSVVMNRIKGTLYILK